MKIGIIGAGNVGGTLGKAWARKGHQVFYAVQRPRPCRCEQLFQLHGRQFVHGHTLGGRPLTQANLARLLGPNGAGRFQTVGPDRGPLACGWVGAGRLIEPQEIFAGAARAFAPPDLQGRRVVVAAGPPFKELAHNKFADDNSRTNATPIVHDGCLLLRTDQYLYCIGKKS